MKKMILAMLLLMACGQVFGGQIGLPVERIALPAVTSTGNYLVCVWDEAAQQWLQGFEPYNNAAGSYDFQVPSWGRWYWIGLWDQDSGQYVFGKWIGHFITN